MSRISSASGFIFNGLPNVGVLKQAGHESAAAIKREHIVAGRDRRAATPAQARNFLDAMRGLFRWALDAGHVKTDPTTGIKNPARPKGGGFPVWTEDDVARYEARWPIGTKERVWFDVLLYTGLRRGEPCQQQQHWRGVPSFLGSEATRCAISFVGARKPSSQ
jgi:integrase